MSESACPLCDNPVRLNERTCSRCGVDLAMAALVTERALRDTRPGGDETVVSPEVLVPRLGERLMEQGLLEEADLRSALAFQKTRQAAGTPVLIGQALVHLGMIDQETLDRTITQQIFQLQDALTHANRDLGLRVRERTRALQNALERLTELNQLKTNFIANISHELRTPLAHIKGYTELMSDGSLGDLSEAQQSAFAVMARSIRRLEGLIDDLIQFSDTAQGEIKLQISNADVPLLFDLVLDRIRQQAPLVSTNFNVVLPEDAVVIKCDVSKITWVLSHLVDNAIKFSDGKGLIDLIAEPVPGAVRISVCDRGIGIAPDKLEEIFEPFHQLDASSTRRFGGTGMGLALVRRILRAHQSEIRVKSELGAGATFYFELPHITGEH